MVGILEVQMTVRPLSKVRREKTSANTSQTSADKSACVVVNR